ncbi:hypothetical protein [Streptomyces brevispora]|uniref:UTRA domain-containing protein n=1 Tax=Streptomyces brevispora TaxID=887462 RepID=A0ABZ1G045_9ACTN|nr:hypothetical protein [Streptomyces brevispora]WSC12766.1 hypothetical protein OIE64_07895 [Streptomyces brevispora]
MLRATPVTANAAGNAGDGERVAAVTPASRTPADLEAAAHLGREPAEFLRLESVVVGGEPWAVSTYCLESTLLPKELTDAGNWTTSCAR